MAELITLARPYARAAFEYADAANTLEAWSKALGLTAAVAQQEAVAKLLGSPSYTAEKKAEAFIEICGEELDAQAKNFVKVLADNARIALLPQISQLFDAFKANKEKSVDVELSTARELPAELQDKLAKALSSNLDREVKLQVQVDAELLGGVVVRAGDTIIDGSVRGRLAKLAEAMNS